ncbi:hypothetical protein DFH28DRAFT_1192295, partial [Melampsora americana]
CIINGESTDESKDYIAARSRSVKRNKTDGYPKNYSRMDVKDYKKLIANVEVNKDRQSQSHSSDATVYLSGLRYKDDWLEMKGCATEPRGLLEEAGTKQAIEGHCRASFHVIRFDTNRHLQYLDGHVDIKKTCAAAGQSNVETYQALNYQRRVGRLFQHTIRVLSTLAQLSLSATTECHEEMHRLTSSSRQCPQMISQNPVQRVAIQNYKEPMNQSLTELLLIIVKLAVCEAVSKQAPFAAEIPHKELQSKHTHQTTVAFDMSIVDSSLWKHIRQFSIQDSGVVLSNTCLYFIQRSMAHPDPDPRGSPSSGDLKALAREPDLLGTPTGPQSGIRLNAQAEPTMQVIRRVVACPDPEPRGSPNNGDLKAPAQTPDQSGVPSSPRLGTWVGAQAEGKVK